MIGLAIAQTLLSMFLLQAGATPAAYADRFVTVNGLRIHYLDWGNAGQPPMILIHGIARHAHTFDHIAPHFAATTTSWRSTCAGTVIRAGIRRAITSSKTTSRISKELVKQLKLTHITMLGNSTGGRVVQVFAGMHPDLVTKLVVEDVGPQRPEDIASGFARRVQQEANGWAAKRNSCSSS